MNVPISSGMDEDTSCILHLDLDLANAESPYGALLEGFGRLTVRARLNAAYLTFKQGRSLWNDDPDAYASFILLGGNDERGNVKTKTIHISYDALDETGEDRQENNAVLMELQTHCTAHTWMS